MKAILKSAFLTGFLLICINITNDPIKAYLTDLKTEIKSDTLKGTPYTVIATMYFPVASQCDNSPLITADGTKINPKEASKQKLVALSRDLLKRWGGSFSYGDLIEIKGIGKRDGIYRVADTMNKRFTNKIDILESYGTPLYKFKEVTIVKVCSS